LKSIKIKKKSYSLAITVSPANFDGDGEAVCIQLAVGCSFAVNKSYKLDFFVLIDT